MTASPQIRVFLSPQIISRRINFAVCRYHPLRSFGGGKSKDKFGYTPWRGWLAGLRAVRVCPINRLSLELRFNVGNLLFKLCQSITNLAD